MTVQSLECTREAYFRPEDEEFTSIKKSHWSNAHVDIFQYSVLHSLKVFCYNFLCFVYINWKENCMTFYVALEYFFSIVVPSGHMVHGLAHNIEKKHEIIHICQNRNWNNTLTDCKQASCHHLKQIRHRNSAQIHDVLRQASLESHKGQEYDLRSWCVIQASTNRARACASVPLLLRHSYCDRCARRHTVAIVTTGYTKTCTCCYL